MELILWRHADAGRLLPGAADLQRPALRLPQRPRAARDAGVQSGDVILGVNGRSVKSVREFRELVSKSGKTVALLVQREGVQIFLPIRIN